MGINKLTTETLPRTNESNTTCLETIQAAVGNALVTADDYPSGNRPPGARDDCAYHGSERVDGIGFYRQPADQIADAAEPAVLWQAIEQELGFCKQIYKFTLLTPYKCLSTSVLH